MRTIPADTTSLPPLATDAERARARLKRIAPMTPDAALGVPDDAPPRRRRPPGLARGFRLGWKGWLLIEGAAVALVLGLVIAWPPVRDCRAQDERTGFYAGDTVGKCIRRGIDARIDWADQRLKMAIRGSGR
ncbi:hypothetical protein [uncultured Methylobacterium sp.]|uniref:hypothetical protein n=1 Tax=uncultured Methylobacterium sp. TaxID=157278 RepID=UPI0035CC9DAF